MKTLTTIIAIILVVGGYIVINEVMKKQPSTEISLMRDVTDSELARPEANQIIPLLGLSHNKWAGAQFRMQNITNVSFNPINEASIVSVNDWLTDEYKRDKDVKAFIGQIEQIVMDSAQDKIGRTHSSVYLPIANELSRLSQSSADRRILLIYSDLMENDPNFSFYNKQTFSLLKNNPDKVKEHFEAEQPLGS